MGEKKVLVDFKMLAYQTKVPKLSGERYGEVRKEALRTFGYIKRKTRRRPYIRSAYFNKQKIFFDYFWEHVFQKSPKERIRRLQYFPPALAVVRYSRNHPLSQENPHKRGEILHRFAGLTKEGDLFYVQIKEDKRSGHKYFMSCFPAE